MFFSASPLEASSSSTVACSDCSSENSRRDCLNEINRPALTLPRRPPSNVRPSSTTDRHHDRHQCRPLHTPGLPMRAAGTRAYSGVLRSSVECIVVPGAGIEPAWPCGRRILSPMRLPVSPSGHGDSLPHSHRIGKRRPSARRKQRSPACGASTCFPGKRTWSGKRDSNSRPRPWQGRALPTELFPHGGRSASSWYLEAWVGIEPAYADLQSAA